MWATRKDDSGYDWGAGQAKSGWEEEGKKKYW